MKAWRKWLTARWVLGSTLLVRLLLFPWVRRRVRPDRWLARMRTEGLAETPAANWTAYAAAARCIGCGRCDLFGNDRVPYPSQLMLGAARLQQDAPALLEQASALAALAPRIRTVCPTQADAEAVANLLRQNAAALAPR